MNELRLNCAHAPAPTCDTHLSCPDSLCDSFRKPVTFFLTGERVCPVSSPCDLFARKQQIGVSCGWFLWRECLKNVRWIPPARIAFTHFHSCVQDFTLVVFLGHAAGIKLQMFDLTRGAYGVYVCVCVCRLFPLPLAV